MSFIEYILWLGYTFFLAKYFYMVGWNSAMDEVQKAIQDSNYKGGVL